LEKQWGAGFWIVRAQKKKGIMADKEIKSFNKGDRVRMTDEAVRHGFDGNGSQFGTVEHAQYGRLVAVRRDGQKSRKYWEAIYWEKVED
jgi:hypothetical protein